MKHVFTKTRKKILGAFGASMMLGSSLVAQNTSYGLNSIPIGGSYNCAYSVNSLSNMSTGSYNVGIGMWSLYYTTTGSENIAVGSSVLGYNNGDKNTGTGYAVLGANTSGYENTGIGNRALGSNTTGYYNTSSGAYSLYSNISGANNVATGYKALYTNNTGVSNTASGYISMYNNTGGYNNSAYGYASLANNQTGNNNTSIGLQSLYNNTTGTNNTGLGFQALYSNATGGGNTAIGVLSDVNASNLTNATAVGYGAIVNASNRVWLGNASSTVWTTNSYNISDQRFKTKINDEDIKGLEFIKLLHPVAYNLDTRKFQEFMTKNMPDSIRKKHMAQDFGPSTAIRQSGFLAQEVEAAAKKAGYDFSGVHVPESDNDTYGLSYYQFVVPLVKAVQEMDKQKTAQDQKIENLQQQLEEQKQMIEELKKQSVTAGSLQSNEALDGFKLNQNEPNPFNNETVIKFTLPKSIGSAYMAIYDLSGKQIMTMPINERGTSSVTITSEKLMAGIYIYSVIADGKVLDSKRMVVTQKQ